tara:strand:- start:307 stop:522 length:216 start_codon:yes stop_codon:yes gene_type:complete
LYPKKAPAPIAIRTIGKVTNIHNMASHPLIKKRTEQRNEVSNIILNIPLPLEVNAITNPVRKGTMIKRLGP